MLNRCNAWILACNLESLLSVPSSIMYKKYRICSQHFQDHDYTSTIKERLKSTACPSKFQSSEDIIIIFELQEGLKNKLANECETSSYSVTINSKSVTGVDETADFPKANDVLECEDVEDDLRVLASTPNRRPNFTEKLNDLSVVSCVNINGKAETALDGSMNIQTKVLTPKRKHNFTEPDTASVENFKKLVFEAVNIASKRGLEPVSTVCDVGSNNQKLFNE
ncbi:hypothetical protein AVEN_83001-1 [Araneus ventricosus]|uniref:THAP-type domain-containing protein n=1 Tax=Araneus ventricosus TaxID=182803 RepID=A0A4Y2GKL9_ARAVE|nr:hypothetical protein AVEN_83001-1 [Araneus ventricosus]